MDEPRATRQERIVLGLLLLSAYLLVLAGIVTQEAATLGKRSQPPSSSLGTQILVLAILTLVAALVLAARALGVANGLKLVARNAWPGLLAGGGLAIVTGFALRVLVPLDVFWAVLGPLYVAAVVFIVWFGQRGSPTPRQA
jgi:hypothetical protein